MPHVLTAIFGYGYNGVSSAVPLSVQAQYANWAYTDSSHAALYRSSGVKVLVYANFWRNYVHDNPNVWYSDLAPGGAHSSAEATACNGTPITDPAYNGGYLSDPRSTAAIGHAKVILGTRSSYGNQYDAFVSDDTGVAGGANGTPCNYSYDSWVAATNSVHAALQVPMFVNAINGWAVGGNQVSQVQTTQPANVLGAQCESCYANNAGAVTGMNWINQENAEIATVNARKIFWDYARNASAADGAQALRTYVIASFLLSYDPKYAMLEEAFATPNNFPIMPESGLVPLDPVQSQSTVSGYQLSSGAFWREFKNCYYRGSAVGPCAVSVNPGSSAVTLPSGYAHSLTLSGSDVFDGGTAAVTGPPVTSLGPSSAAVLFL